jgi:hypothetical protein
MDYTPSPSSPNMGMKKKAVAAKMATNKKKKMDTTGFLSVDQVKKMKKAGKFKGFDANPEGSSKPKE